MDLNKNNMKKILGIITFTILLLIGVLRLGFIVMLIGAVLKLVFPFILGGGIAFILNVPMRGIEKGIFSKIKSKKSIFFQLRRPISLIMALLTVFGIILLVVFLLVPEIGRAVGVIVTRSPEFFRQFRDKYEELMITYPAAADYIGGIKFNWEKVGQSILNFVRNSGGSMLQSTFGIASSILGGLFSFFLGLIFSIYILIQKEKLGRQTKKLLYAYIPEMIADRIVSICELSAKTFSKFLSGQCLEAAILGSMFFLTMSILNFPYAMMISVLIGFTALVPIFGSFIGLVIGTFLILIVNPVQALWFVILFMILQQIEGNFIYPHVVGGSIGLPSMWVLVAVTIGGSTMGVAGMLIFIPLASVLYTLLREAVNKRLAKKKVNKNKYNS